MSFGPESSNVGALDAGVAVLEDIECRARALDAERIAALASLHEVAAREAEAVGERGPVEASMAYRSVQADVAAALHAGNTSAGMQLHDAHLVATKYPGTLAALSSGEISRAHVRVITDAGRIIGTEYGPDEPVDAERRAHFEAQAVTKAISTTPAALASFAKRTAEQFATVPLDERHERARAHRMVTVTPLDDGMARLCAVLPAHHAMGAASRLRALAKQLQAVETQAHHDARELAATQGHEPPNDRRRTRSQIQADILADLLLNSTPDTADPAIGGSGFPVVRGIVQIITHSEHLTGSLADVLDAATGATAAGVPVPELTSYGPLPIRAARDIAADTPAWIDVATSTTDGAGGEVTRIEPRFPTLRQRRHLIARDDTCRWFGCMMPAHHCDVDHTVEYRAGGKTSTENLGHLCRNHHLLKHHGGWSLTQHDSGHYELRSPSGRTYRTSPASRVRFHPTNADDDLSHPPPSVGAAPPEGFETSGSEERPPPEHQTPEA